MAVVVAGMALTALDREVMQALRFMDLAAAAAELDVVHRHSSQAEMVASQV